MGLYSRGRRMPGALELGMILGLGLSGPALAQEGFLDDIAAPEAGTPTADPGGASRPAQSDDDKLVGARRGGASTQSAGASSESEILNTIPVQTQESNTPVPQRAAASPPQIEEIIVTATKRNESVRDIPASIDVLQSDDLMKSGSTSLDEIVQKAPGTSKAGFRVVMRGVATSALGSYGTSEEVGRFLGDVSLSAPAGRGALIDLDPFDMRNIEIAKGPQGTLFGGTALSGAVRYIPNAPDVHDYSAAIRGGIGSVAHSRDLQREGNAMVNLAFADSVGLRVVGSYRDRPGVIDDLYADEHDIDDKQMYQWRAMGRWQPLDNLDVDLTYMRYREERGDLGFTSAPDRYEQSNLRTPQPSIMTSKLLNARVEYRFDTFSIVAMAADLDTYFFDTADVSMLLLGGLTAPPYLSEDVDTRVPRTRTYEARILSTEPTESSWWILRDWNYLLGVSYLKSDSKIDSNLIATVLQPDSLPILADGLDVPVNTTLMTEAQEKAVFFDLTKGLFDRRVELNIGGRLARSSLDANSYINEGGVHLLPGTHSDDKDRFNPKVAITVHLTDDASVYASAVEGFRFGGVNAGPTAGIDYPRAFKSDSLFNYEIGLRTDWLDRTLRFDIAGYRIDWDNLQIQQISTLSASNFVTNVGQARILGAEATMRWNLPGDVFLIPEGLSIVLSGNYNDARTTQAFDSTNGPVEKGTRLPTTPYFSMNGSINWQGGIGNWGLDVSLSDAYAGSRKAALVENTPRMPAYHTLGAVLTVSNAELPGQPSLSLAGANLLDKNVPNFAFKDEYGPGYTYYLNLPRSVLLSLELRME